MSARGVTFSLAASIISFGDARTALEPCPIWLDAEVRRAAAASASEEDAGPSSRPASKIGVRGPPP